MAASAAAAVSWLIISIGENGGGNSWRQRRRKWRYVNKRRNGEKISKRGEKRKCGGVISEAMK